jgi:NAD-dependent dihydropyrimidine dehydrogenase PreA subunit
VAPDGLPSFARWEDCSGCRSCELHCPDFAIRLVYAAGDADPAEQEVA